jgi:DNA-binding HxlR family transcriptional regulator
VRDTGAELDDCLRLVLVHSRLPRRELLYGSTRFNDLRRGVPRMSPALLSKRLKELEQAGVIAVTPGAQGGTVEYKLTEAGEDLRGFVMSLGIWGQRWVESSLSLKKLDPAFLMWDMRRNLKEVRVAAGTLGLPVATLEIRRAGDIAPAFEAHKGHADALYVVGDLLTIANRTAINTWALGARLPTIYAFREDVEAGALMSYGTSLPDLYRRAADYVDKILRGAKPADLPVEQPTKFSLVINLTTAKVLGLQVPPMLLARADRVIE